MEFRLTEKDFWHDRLLLMGKDRLTKRFGKPMTGDQARLISELKGCTWHPETLSKSAHKVRSADRAPGGQELSPPLRRLLQVRAEEERTHRTHAPKHVQETRPQPLTQSLRLPASRKRPRTQNRLQARHPAAQERHAPETPRQKPPGCAASPAATSARVPSRAGVGPRARGRARERDKSVDLGGLAAGRTAALAGELERPAAAAAAPSVT